MNDLTCKKIINLASLPQVLGISNSRFGTGTSHPCSMTFLIVFFFQSRCFPLHKIHNLASQKRSKIACQKIPLDWKLRRTPLNINTEHLYSVHVYQHSELLGSNIVEYLSDGKAVQAKLWEVPATIWWTDTPSKPTTLVGFVTGVLQCPWPHCPIELLPQAYTCKSNKKQW